MRKKIFIAIFCTLATATVSAQDVWQLPQQQQQQETKQKKVKEKKEATGNAQEKKAKVVKIDSIYAEGAVPEVDGKVEWTETIDTKYDAQSNYDRMYAILEALTKTEVQREASRIAIVNPTQHIIAAQFVEELTFKKLAFSHDFTDFKYTIIATCSDNKVEVKLCRITYKYEPNTAKPQSYNAEEWITDSKSMNKAHTKLYPINGKFRRRTIDRKNEIFEEIKRKMKE